MRQKKEIIHNMKDYSLGEILALTLQDLRKTKWEVSGTQGNVEIYTVSVAVLEIHNSAIRNILSCGISYFNLIHNTKYDGDVFSGSSYSHHAFTIIQDPNSALTPAQFADALEETINQLFADIIGLLENPTLFDIFALPKSHFEDKDKSLKKHLAKNPSHVIVKPLLQLVNGENYRYVDITSILGFLIKRFKFSDDIGIFSFQISCDPATYVPENFSCLVSHVDNLAVLKDLLIREINETNPVHLNPPVQLLDSCLNWFSKINNHRFFTGNSRHLPKHLTEDFESASFPPVNYWDDLKPFSGKIILYKSKQKLFFEEGKKSFLLYPEFPDIKVGMITEDVFRRSMGIGFRIGLFELTETVSIGLLGSPNPLLTTAFVRFTDIGIRAPTLSELQTIRQAAENSVAAFFETAKSKHIDHCDL